MTFPTFAEFHHAAHETEPYRWQERLCEEVVATGEWPEQLALATGTGKTTCIDIALYALAAGAAEAADGAPPAARRIVLVADRRALVDQAWRRGTRLLEVIAKNGTLAPIRDALHRLSPDNDPVSVRLRGACPTDPRWCRSADQVLIVASTVDQVGSRLLMRGYGVSPGMRPVEAGLLAQDTLILLDEAHLSGPFADTVQALDSHQPVRGLVPRRRLVTLSATPGPRGPRGQVFRLKPRERREPRLARRLDAKRTFEWRTTRFARSLAELLDADAPIVLAVANTVRTALAWYDDASKADLGRHVELVTGLMRPLDRDATMARIEYRIEARTPTLVVATQCIEAGVDLDADAMITECAAWDSLVQRSGRVNRRGLRREARCLVMPAARDTVKGETKDKQCPVYGEHELVTARWLAERCPFTTSPGALPTPPEKACRPVEHAPRLLPEYLDLWSCTRAEDPAIDVSPYLHGAREDRSVSVLWRDIELNEETHDLAATFAALPPSSLEAVAVPIAHARDWLGKREFARIDGRVMCSRMLRPGMIAVVPLAHGGMGDHGTFDGTTTSSVTDLAARALCAHRGLKFEVHEIPPDVNEDETPAERAKRWIDADPDRAHLTDWHRVDTTRRWIFAKRLPALDTDDDAWSFRRLRNVTLEQHLAGVAERTTAVATRLGLPTRLVDDLTLAARIHDVGKLDPRMQRLFGRRPSDPPLAKSTGSRRRRLSDYPRGERHEALSVAIARASGLHAAANDLELVEHLVASHHGWARPFIRAPQGSAAIDAEICSVAIKEELRHAECRRAPARFARLQNRYGWLGLAWLECILRLADHRQSSAEERGTPATPEVEPLDPGPIPADRSQTCTVPLFALNGWIPLDMLAALGVLHAVAQRHDCAATLHWEDGTPILQSPVSKDELVTAIAECRRPVSWPLSAGKVTPEACCNALVNATGMDRAILTGLVSPAGRSPMDFLSGGRGSLKATVDWLCTTPLEVEDLSRTLFGPRDLVAGTSGEKPKTLRWGPLDGHGARRGKEASADKQAEPWLEWLAVLGAGALTAVPGTYGGRLTTRSTALGRGGAGGNLRLQWPLWHIPVTWSAAAALMASTRSGLPDAEWLHADRVASGPKTNRQYSFGETIIDR